MKNFLVSLILLVSWDAMACTNIEFVRNITKGFPKQVELLAFRIIQCNHWNGESTEVSPERKQQIEKGYTDNQCSTIDKDKEEFLKLNAKKEKFVKAIEAAQNWKPRACH